MKTYNDLLERLAENAHDSWSRWVMYMFSQMEHDKENGVLFIPVEKQRRWFRQMNTSYEKLTEKEKQSDRAEAYKILKIVLEEFFPAEIIR